jgi:5-methylcytosine-specific restriction endonuclease McrA
MVRNLNNATGEAVRKLAADGMSVSEIMDALNVSVQTVYLYAKGFGFSNRNSHEDIRELRRAGVSVFDIKIITGKDLHIISSVCREMGLGLTDEEYQEERKRDSERKTHSDEWARNYIAKQSGGRLEYVSGYISMDDHVLVRCTHCGCEQERAFASFRSCKNVLCKVCKYNPTAEAEREKRREAKEKQKQIQKIEKETQRLIKEGRGEQMSLSFCECGNIKKPYYKQCTGCSRAAENKRHELKRRRKVSAAMVDKDITLEKLYQRDSGYCYICGSKCDWNDKEERHGTVVCGNTYPSIDHVVPLARGGLHSWENVRLAHRICNSIKSDKTA